jgi:hypothetical protein
MDFSMKTANRQTASTSRRPEHPDNIDLDELKRQLRGVRFVMKDTRVLCERAADVIEMMQNENAALVSDLGVFHMTANTETLEIDMRGVRIKQLESVLDQIARLGTAASNAELSAIAAAVFKPQQ